MIQRTCVECGAISDQTRCPAHRRKPWSGSKRRSKVKSGWAQQKEAQSVLAIHDTICHVCGQPGATQVDHVIPIAEGGQDTIANKRPIHPIPCHRNKTQAEALRGRQR